MPPACAHLARGMRDTLSAEIAGKIFHQPSAIVVVEPVFQVMQTREIIAGAFAAAVPIQFDVMQQTVGCPVRLRFVQHPGEAESDLKKRPAIHPLKIYRGRLDPIVDFQGEMFVTCSYQRLPGRRGPLSDRQSFPISGFGLCNEPVELILAFESRAKWQPRCGC